MQNAKCKTTTEVWRRGAYARCILQFAICILQILPSLALAQTSAASGVDQDNVIIVLDASGSMRTQMNRGNKSRMDVAKSALKTVLADVPATTNVGLLVFSSNIRNDWVYPLKPISHQELSLAIDKAQPGGGTPLGAYLKKGTDALLKQRRAQHGFGTYRLLVVTDGKASDQNLVDRYLPDVLSRGITVDVIGVDMAPDLSLATQVHSYRTAGNLENLVEAVKNVFAEIGSGDDSSTKSEEDFAIIAPLPDQLAVAMITALSNVSDYPIGEEPPLDVASSPGSPPVAAPPGNYDPFQPGLPPQPDRGSSFLSKVGVFLKNLCFFGFILVVIFALFLIQAGKSAQRRNRR